LRCLILGADWEPILVDSTGDDNALPAEASAETNDAEGSDHHSAKDPHESDSRIGRTACDLSSRLGH
jgi:hypothetical protein